MLEQPFFLLALTLACYLFNIAVQKRLNSVYYNPLLFTVAMLIGFLLAADIHYDTYYKAGMYIDFWLQPAIVALAVPLYTAWDKVRAQWLPVLLSQLIGSIAGIISVVFLAKIFGLSDLIALSLAAKSVTTPIAMEVTKTLGGMPSLTAAAVIITGILGNVIGFPFMQRFLVRRPISQSLSMGTASHAIGVAAAMQRSSKFAAFASLGLVLNGIITAIIAPFIVPALLKLLG